MTLCIHIRSGQTLTVEGVRIVARRGTDLLVLDPAEIVFPNGRIALPPTAPSHKTETDDE